MLGLRTLWRVTSWVLTVLVALLAISFAVGNRTPTIIQLWPFGFEAALPIYLLALLPLLFGLLAGGLLFWLIDLPRRYEIKRLKQETERQRAQINRLRDELAEAKSQPTHQPPQGRWQLPVPWL